MLVCHVSQLARRAAIAADLTEAATATEASALGNVVFATLVDDPASVRDFVDAYSGEIMREAASAAASINAGLTYNTVISEAAAAAEISSAGLIGSFTAAMVETASAVDAPDGILAVTYATWDSATVASVTLSGGNLVATNTGTTSANQGAHVVSTSGKTSGKYYFEVTVTTASTGNNRGIAIGTTASTYTNMGNSATTGVALYPGTGAIWANGSNTGITIPSGITSGVAGIAVDLDNRRIWFRKGAAGNWNNSGTANPATNTGGITIPAGTMVPFVTFGGTVGVANNVFTANFGASVFSGATPSGFTSGWPV